MTQYCADICDQYPDKVSVLGPGFIHYGGAVQCEGEVVTIRLDRNNTDLIRLLREPGQGRVVVVDVGQAYYAVVGENLMRIAETSGYVGMVINGYVRDTLQIKDIPVVLYALGTCPRKYIPVTAGELEARLSFAGVDFHTGQYLYADTDGVVVTPESVN